MLRWIPAEIFQQHLILVPSPKSQNQNFDSGIESKQNALIVLKMNYPAPSPLRPFVWVINCAFSDVRMHLSLLFFFARFVADIFLHNTCWGVENSHWSTGVLTAGASDASSMRNDLLYFANACKYWNGFKAASSQV